MRNLRNYRASLSTIACIPPTSDRFESAQERLIEAYRGAGRMVDSEEELDADTSEVAPVTPKPEPESEPTAYYNFTDPPLLELPPEPVFEKGFYVSGGSPKKESV